MAAGVPVVATAVGGTPEVVVQNETGLLVPPNAPTDLAQALDSLLDDPTRRATFAEVGRTRVREHFTFAAMAAAYETLFSTLPIRSPALKEVAHVGS
jgi:glycosyltransferase involved in cell wall biosynthesis